MSRRSKRFREIEKQIDVVKQHTIEEAIDLLKKASPVKFDQSVEVSLKMGVDQRKSDQQVRGTVPLPHGTGKKITVLVFAKGDKAQEASDAGADYVGTDELVAKIKEGWVDFDCVVATPDMMREVGKLGKVLGPRGLMPTPKAGTVTMNIANAIKEIKAGKIEFKTDRHAVINNAVGKLSFDKEKLMENINVFLSAVKRLKPAAVKGYYMKSMSLSSTMGPGIKIDSREISIS